MQKFFKPTGLGLLLTFFLKEHLLQKLIICSSIEYDPRCLFSIIYYFALSHLESCFNLQNEKLYEEDKRELVIASEVLLPIHS